MFDDPLQAAQHRRREKMAAFRAAVEIAKRLRSPRAQRAAIRNLVEHAINDPDLKEDTDGNSLPRPNA